MKTERINIFEMNKEVVTIKGLKVKYADLVMRPKFRNYNKQTVLKALLMYHKLHKQRFEVTRLNNLYTARNRFGTQFLLDLFVFTELYIKHWPIVDIPKCREDLVTVLNNLPDFRLQFEEGKIVF